MLDSIEGAAANFYHQRPGPISLQNKPYCNLYVVRVTLPHLQGMKGAREREKEKERERERERGGGYVSNTLPQSQDRVS